MEETMTETEEKSGQSKAETAGQGAKLLVDVGPIVVFVVAYNLGRRWAGDDAIFWSTGAYMAAVAVALPFAWFTQKRLPPLLLMTAGIVFVMGALTLWLQSEIFAYVKPTIINGSFAVLIAGSLIFRYNVFKLFFGGVFELPEQVWRILAWRWAGWFTFLAILNEIMWRSTPEAFWANFKLWGVMPLTFLFGLANAPMIMKWSSRKDEEFQEWLVTKAR
jgi:intracellular septation protein